MNRYLYCSQVFLYIISTNGNMHRANNVSTHEDTPNLMFADVIKNITRVNNVLQELIKNYDKLQKIYKSQETLDSEGDTEVKEQLRDGKHKRMEKVQTEAHTMKPIEFQVTRMMGSDESTDQGIHLDSLENRAPSIIESDEEEVTKSKPKNPIKDIYHIQKSDLEAPTRPDIHPDQNTIAINNVPVVNLNQGNSETSLLRLNVGTPVMQIKKTDESSEENMWTDIKNNKPVHLNIEKDINYSKRQTDDGLRHIPVANDTITYTIASDIDSGDDDRTIKKEQFKTRILRRAYGDACLKVVVKKCYKACKGVLEDTCREYNCKHNLKSSFKEHSKKGCIKEFQELELRQSVYEGHKISRAVDNLLDLTRNGYLAAACLPNEKVEAKTPKRRTNQTVSKASSIEPDKELNILRDRFERACQKTSSNKCIKACHYAINETCVTHKCPRKTKSDFKKKCRMECEKAYGYSKKSSESDSDTSGSSDSSESGSSSDSDKTMSKKRHKLKMFNAKPNIHRVNKNRDDKDSKNEPQHSNGRDKNVKHIKHDNVGNVKGNQGKSIIIWNGEERIKGKTKL